MKEYIQSTEIKFKVVGVYEDDSEDTFEELNTYEEAEAYIRKTTYEAVEFKIEKVFRNKKSL